MTIGPTDLPSLQAKLSGTDSITALELRASSGDNVAGVEVTHEVQLKPSATCSETSSALSAASPQCCVVLVGSPRISIR